MSSDDVPPLNPPTLENQIPQNVDDLLSSNDDQNEEEIQAAQYLKHIELFQSKIENHRDYVVKFDAAINSVENLECRLEMLNEIYEEYRDLEIKLRAIVNLSDFRSSTTLTEVCNSFADQFCLTKGLIKRKINQNPRNIAANANDGFINDMKVPSITKLPAIPIPEFDGDVKNWTSFRDTFQAVVINQQISEVAKLYYLKEALKKGLAWNLVSEFQTTDDSFCNAWQTLERRYDNKNVIIDHHVNELFKMKSIKNECAADLWKLVEGFSMNLRALESLGEPIESWSTLLINMIKYRLDENTRRLWEASVLHLKNRPSLKDIENFVVTRCHVLESLEVVKGITPGSRKES